MVKRVLITVFLLAIFFLTSAAADAATLFLSPSSDSRTVGDSFSVSVRVNTGGVAINSAQATVFFPNDLLEVISLSQSGVFSLWPVNPSFSNGGGTVSFAGGLPSPGYTGSSGTIILITFKAKAVGTATVTLDSASVLANDGFGTDVLTSLGSGSFIITAVGEEAPPPPESKIVPRAPAISSDTHPEQSLWYADPDPDFTWTNQAGVTGFSIVYDDQEATVPDSIRDTTQAQQSYSGIGDGQFYFHVRAENTDGWGSTGHYLTQIDTTDPLTFAIDFLDGNKSTKTSIRISFETTDATSGIHRYELIVDDGTPVGIDVGATTPYTLGSLSAGQHTLTVIAYDNAGNSTPVTATFSVARPNPPILILDDKDQPDQIILETIEELLPGPVRDITRKIGETIGKLRRNEDVVRVFDEIIKPLVGTTAIVAATGIATTITALQLSNLFYLLLRIGYLWFIPITVGKRRKPWGVVFDSTTGNPIKQAVVRIFSKEFNKLKESQITDGEGRFGFLVDIGKYFVTVTRFGFQFPSKLMVSATASKYDDIYRGDTLDIKQKIQQALSINIPIDPNNTEIPQRRIFLLKILNIFGQFLEKISLPLLIVGTISSWLSLIILPSTNNYLYLMVYGFLIIFKYLIAHHYERSWGSVSNALTNEPIELAVVRIYDMKSSMIVGTRVTNRSGQFQALVAPGQYYIVVVKSGFKPFQSEPMTVTKEKGLIKVKIDLQPSGSSIITSSKKKTDQVVQLKAMNEPEPSVPPKTSPAKTTDPRSPFAPPPQHEVISKKLPAATTPPSQKIKEPPSEDTKAKTAGGPLLLLKQKYQSYLNQRQHIMDLEIDLALKTQGDTAQIINKLMKASDNRDGDQLIACLLILARQKTMVTALRESTGWTGYVQEKYSKLYNTQVVADAISNLKLDPVDPAALSEFLQYFLKERLKMSENDSALVGVEIGQILKDKYQGIAYGNQVAGIFEWTKIKIENQRFIIEGN